MVTNTVFNLVAFIAIVIGLSCYVKAKPYSRKSQSESPLIVYPSTKPAPVEVIAPALAGVVNGQNKQGAIISPRKLKRRNQQRINSKARYASIRAGSILT